MHSVSFFVIHHFKVNFIVRLFEKGFLHCVFFTEVKHDFCKHSALLVSRRSQKLTLPVEKSPEKFSGSSLSTRELSE